MKKVNVCRTIIGITLTVILLMSAFNWLVIPSNKEAGAMGTSPAETSPQISASLPSGSISITYDFPEPGIEIAADMPPSDGAEKPFGGDYISVTMEDLPLWSEEGQPVLPFKTAQILLPHGSEVQSITVTHSNKIVIPGSYTVVPGQESVPLSYEGLVEPTAPDTITYSSDEAFPGYLYSDDVVQVKTGYIMLLLNLHPIEYIPAEGQLSYYESMTVKVTYTSGVASDSLAVRDSTQDREIISNMVDNPAIVSSYDAASTIKESTLLPTDDYEYVIITNADLESNTPGPNNFQALRDDKIAGGMTAAIVTTEWIYANYDGTRPDGGADDQTRIRNFITDAYNNWGTRYVLLGGDGDGGDVGGESGDAIIPHRGFSCGGDYDIPADMYYACLDGTFDYNADGIYGEPNDGPDGGEVDLYAEVYVGRAPVDSYDEVTNFVSKTLYYTHLPISDTNLRKVWMVGEYLGFGGIAEWGGNSKDEIKEGSDAHGYTTIGFEDSDYFYSYDVSTLYDRDWPGGDWPVSEIISVINDDAHLINHLGHAYVGNVMKMVNSDVDALTNEELYFIGYSQGCYDGAFDNRDDWGSYTDYDCISEHLTVGEHGAVAFVSNSRYGYGEFFSTDGPSQHYDREFWDALLNEDILTMGEANQDSKEDNAGRVGNWIERWCYYELNLFGDPALEVKINRGEAGIVYNDHLIDDSGGNGWADSGESFTLDVTLENREAQDATFVSAMLLTSDPYVTITDNQEDWGDIDAGATLIQESAFAIDIAADVPDQHRCTFTVEVTGDGPTLPPPWLSGFHIIVNAPEFSVGSMAIDDSSGDGDGLLDPGETANILVDTANIGHYGAEDTTAYLFCPSGYLTINTPSDDLGLILGGDSTTAIFSVSILPDAPIGELINLDYLVISGSYSAYESFTKMLGCTYSQVGYVGDDGWTVNSYPFNTYWMDSRTQSILLADEIQFAGPIQKVKLFCVQLPGQNLENFYIRMQHTTMDSFPSNEFVNDDWTYVLSATDVDVSQWNIPGWVEFRLDTPFYYNGVDNLLIDYCVDNSFWTSGGLCHVMQAPGRTLTDITDDSDGDLLSVTYGQSLDWLNNIILTDSPVPTLLYPRDGSPLESGDILFEWSAEPTAISYIIQIDTVDTFDSPDLIQESSGDTQFIATLSDYGTYYWRVCAMDSGGHYSAYPDTWSLNIADPVVQISDSPNWDYRPAVTQAGDGNIWVVWEADRDWQNHIWYRTSPDAGYTWSAEMPLDTGYSGGHAPDIAQTWDGTPNGCLWLVWFDYRSGNADLWYMTSPDYGATWSPPVQLTDDPSSDVCPSITQTIDGTIWIVWQSYRSGNGDIWYKTSTDYGATWSEDTQLTTDPSYDNYPSITQDFYDGKIWIAWQSSRSGGNGIWVTNSADGGVTWVPDYPADLNGQQGSDPDMASTDDGILWLVWYGWDSESSNVWYANSGDGGVSGSNPIRYTRFLGPDEYPAAAGLIGGELALVWQSDRAAKNNYDIFFGVIGRNADVYPPPFLEYVWHYPDGPEAGEEITVRATVRDESGINNVQLVWWQDGIPQPNLPMYDDGNHDDYGTNDGTYGVQIGPFPFIGTVIEYQVQITDIDGITVITPVYPFNFEIQPPFVKTADVLMVADNPDYGDWYIHYYTDAMQNSGYSYDIWEIDRRGEVPWEILSQYIDGIVVWSTPQWGYISNDTTMNTLASYLDSGGKLFISGQDIGSQIGWSWFYQDYLHANFVQDDIGLYGLYSVPPISPMYLSISGGWGADNQYWPDEIDPIAPAETTFVYDPGAILDGEALTQIDEAAHTTQYNLSCMPGFDDISDKSSQQQPSESVIGTLAAASSGTGALRVDTGTYKLVYFAFGFEAINSASDRSIVMSNILAWLSGLGDAIVSVSPASQQVDPEQSFDIDITVDPSVAIAGVQFSLSFDASLLQANIVTEGDLLNQGGSETIFNPGNIDNEEGTITDVYGIIAESGGSVSDAGTFATISFTTRDVWGTSSLDMSDVLVGDPDAEAVSMTVNNGTVQISKIGDLTGDNRVNVLDMIRIGQHWGQTGSPGWIPEDIKPDGVINVLDMIIIGQHWTG